RSGRACPAPEATAGAAELLRSAERPVIVVGGGALRSDTAQELLALVESTGGAVVTTWNGKGGFPEDHPLFAGAVGQTGTIPGNTVAAGADVVLSVGCRFT